MPTIWNIPDTLWRVIEPILNYFYPPKPTGRPRVDFRLVLDTILYRGRSGCQWNHLPGSLADDSTAHRWFQRMSKDGVFAAIWHVLCQIALIFGAINLVHLSADSHLGKAKMPGDATGKNPTDRAKRGTKRGILVESNGRPIGIVVAAANVHDSHLLGPVLENAVIDLPGGCRRSVSHLFVDRGFSSGKCRSAAKDSNLILHLPGESHHRYEERNASPRWKAERAISWMTGFRAIATRYEKKAINHEGLCQYASFLLVYRAIHAQIFGL